ncbi:MAG: class I SAM-dependent methyltransferase [Candidatus Nanoarchaeia archaeon]|nr:class I SAM-dependent methyltransferase [Candidatus Nanoarchaeia archaeon]
MDAVEKTIKEYNRIAESYALENDSEDVFDVMKPLLDRFKSHTGYDKIILDAGCGHGRDAWYLTQSAYDVVGIDLSDRILDIARKRAPRAEFFKMDMRNLLFSADIFDGIWACASFLHIPKQESYDVLSQFYRVLKSDGVLFLCVKEGDSEGFVSSKSYGGCERYFSYYSLYELEKLLNNSGFEIFEAVKTKSFINTYSRVKKTNDSETIPFISQVI